MAESREDPGGREEFGHLPGTGRREHFDHLAVGYTDRSDLDDFLAGEGVNLVVRGPIHTGANVGEIATMGEGVSSGMPCLVVPLTHARFDEIRREVDSALDVFQERWEPTVEGNGSAGFSSDFGDGENGRRGSGRRRTYGETGGTARGTSSGAIRKGSIEPGKS